MDPQNRATDRIEGILSDLVRPADYVKWEYFSRQRLLATGVVDFREGRPGRVLDIGCGYGALALTLAESASLDVVAMDVLEERVRSVREKKASRDPATAGSVRIVRANAEVLPFRDEMFDAVVATEVLEHLDEPERMLREARRVLRPGGRLFLTTPNAKALPYRLLRFLPAAAVRKLAATLTPESLHPDLRHDPGAHRASDHPDWHRREGFTIREVDSLGSRSGLRMHAGYTYRIPLPDRIMNRTPRSLSRRLAKLGTRPFPFGLQLYVEFSKT